MSVPAYKLEEAGFSKPQVEALSEFMQTEAARRSDLLELKADLKADIASVKTDLAAVKAELKTDIAKQDGKLILLQWMMGFVLAFMAAILGKLFLTH